MSQTNPDLKGFITALKKEASSSHLLGFNGHMLWGYPLIDNQIVESAYYPRDRD